MTYLKFGLAASVPCLAWRADTCVLLLTACELHGCICPGLRSFCSHRNLIYEFLLLTACALLDFSVLFATKHTKKCSIRPLSGARVQSLYCATSLLPVSVPNGGDALLGETYVALVAVWCFILLVVQNSYFCKARGVFF